MDAFSTSIFDEDQSEEIRKHYMSNLMTGLALTFVFGVIVCAVGWIMYDKKRKKETKGVVLTGKEEPMTPTTPNSERTNMETRMINDAAGKVNLKTATELINLEAGKKYPVTPIGGD